MSPSYFLLKGLGKRQPFNENNPTTQKGNNRSGHDENHCMDPTRRNSLDKENPSGPLQNNQATLQELRKLNDELPNYEQNQ